MAKSTGEGASFTPAELRDPDPPIRVRRAELGRVDQLAGTDSSERLPKEQQSNAQETVNRLEPAQTTGSHSSQTDTVDSAADSMDGVGQTTETESSEEELIPYSEWTNNELQEECRARELPVSGRKDELIARLEAYDSELESDEDSFE